MHLLALSEIHFSYPLCSQSASSPPTNESTEPWLHCLPMWTVWTSGPRTKLVTVVCSQIGLRCTEA